MPAHKPLLKSKKLDAILVTSKPNIRYWSGFTGTSGFLLLGNESLLFTDFRYTDVAKRELQKPFKVRDITGGTSFILQQTLKKAGIKKMGFEGEDMSVNHLKYFQGIADRQKFVDVSRELSAVRMEKSPEELKKLQKAQHITDQILAKLKTLIRPGQQEQEIAFLIETLARSFGAEDISFPPIAGINEHSASPHHHSGSRKIKKGDMILLDFGVLYKGYCSDMTRVLFPKSRKTTDREREIYGVILEAQETAIKKIKAGITGAKADQIARSIIEKAGFGGRFGHSLGHGIGLEVHERPSVSSRSAEKLPKNTVVTVEPGIYLDGALGIRLEDMVQVTGSGTINLTKSPKSIEKSILMRV